MPWRKKDKPEKSPLKLVAWTAVIGLIIGLLGIGQLAEDQLRIARNKVHAHPASGDIVLVKIDDESLQQIGRWPWPRRRHAELVDKLTQAGANRIFFDIILDTASNPTDDRLLADAIRRSGRVTLPVHGAPQLTRGTQELVGPFPLFKQHAQLNSIGVYYNYQNAVWHLPKAAEFEGRTIPSMAASLAGVKAASTESIRVDYSVNTSTIPAIRAGDILKGKVATHRLRGRDVVIAVDAGLLGDRYFIPGVGKMAGAYVQIIGAETLKSGNPIAVGWFLPLLLAIGCAALAAFQRDSRRVGLMLAPSAVAVLAVPIVLEANQVFVDVVPALFVILAVWGRVLWRGYKSGGLINPVSGLPNLSALKSSRSGREQVLVGARISNYADVVANLPSEAERALVEQIVSRLSVGSAEKVIYHGDGGIFAWFEDPGVPSGNHVDALHALFRNPVKVGDLQVDLTIAFGLEIGSARSPANRLASALVAAEEAVHDGLRWKIHDPEKLQDASWRLSILSQLDQAIEDGQVWVAYQPKLNLRTRRIVGAEALARWSHPEKGPIAAAEFIPAAEQSDRIGKLTDFVLEDAIRLAASINSKGTEFHVAVNLSARSLAERNLVSKVSAMLLKHLLEPAHLTLELTETSAIASGEALHILSGLRGLGVRISIDDYGTGFSTLDYLKKVPATELKIDQSFIRGLSESRSDRVMVQSTIALAHSLGRTVVAEGVEQQEVLDALFEMNCDVAQGFLIGRPMSADSLRRRLSGERRASVA